MATRLYLSSTSQTFSPQLQATYTKQSDAVYRTMTRTKGTTTFEQPLTYNGGGTTNAGDDFLLGVYRWELGAQTITGTVTGVIRMREEYGSALYLASTTLSVQSSDFATVRGVLRSQTTGDLTGTETLGLENTRIFNGESVTSVAASNGDWLVLECAIINPTGIGGTRYVQMEYGENAADLAFDATGITQGAPWLEFSQTLLAKDETLSTLRRRPVLLTTRRERKATVSRIVTRTWAGPPGVVSTLPADYYRPRNPTVTIAPSIRCTVTVRPSLSVTPTITQ